MIVELTREGAPSMLLYARMLNIQNIQALLKEYNQLENDEADFCFVTFLRTKGYTADWVEPAYSISWETGEIIS